jgi:hypothetical protein
MATTTTRTEVTRSNGKTSRLETARTVVADAVGEATTAAGSIAADASARLPVAASTTRAAFDDANRRIHASSDEMLRIGTAVSFGFAAGLLIAGANRMLVAMALIPVAMIGLTMLERSSSPGGVGDAAGVPGGL